ncbi:MAG: hypothetical protein WA653_18320, partial [Candidatus Sulfotelmatobacter sp.]
GLEDSGWAENLVTETPIVAGKQSHALRGMPMQTESSGLLRIPKLIDLSASHSIFGEKLYS